MPRLSEALGIMAFALGLGGLAGCAALPPSAVQRIKEADGAYRSRHYETAERLLSPIIDAHPHVIETAEALYLRALCRLRNHDRAAARRDLEAALALTRRNDLIDLLHTQLGNLEFDEERYNRAVVYYEQVYKDLPDRLPKDQVGYQYGLALLRSGQFYEGRNRLAEVAKQFPAGEFAVQARRKAEWAFDYFSIQCGAYRNIAGAHEHAQALKKQSLDAVAIPDPATEPKLYVVRVGCYHTYAAAKEALTRIHQVQPDAMIVP